MANSMLSLVRICGRFSFNRGQINEWYFVNGLVLIINVVKLFTARANGFEHNWFWQWKSISHSCTLLKLNAFSLNSWAMDVIVCGWRRNDDRSVFNWNDWRKTTRTYRKANRFRPNENKNFKLLCKLHILPARTYSIYHGAPFAVVHSVCSEMHLDCSVGWAIV